MGSIIERIKRLNHKYKKLLICGVVVVALLLALTVVFSGSGDVTIDVETSLKEIILASKLRTAEYTYNSIAEVKDGKNTKYYVSYNGTVFAGVDFERIEVSQEEDTIYIIVPDVVILEVVVDPELDYIFTKDKYDTETTFAEATAACKKDLLEKANNNETLMSTARESAEDTIKALIKPLESQLNQGEAFEIIFDTEEADVQ